MKRIDKLLAIRPTHLGDIAKAYYFLTLAGYRLFVRRENLTRWLIDTTEQPPLSHQAERRMDQAALWTNRAARIPFPIARCLQRSLALCLWLEHEGYRPSLQVGARRQGNKLDAHAWVEYRGRVINDRDSVKAVFSRLSRPTASPADNPQ